jgi:NAD(P)-dependent dehydrogenase (short-subunit alcohol dehydrogenase family)
MVQLDGKRAVVTGGSRGISAAIAVALAEAGADVVISYERAADRAQGIVEQIEAKGWREGAPEWPTPHRSGWCRS